MKIRKLFAISLAAGVIGATGCVPANKFDDLQSKYNELEQRQAGCADSLGLLSTKVTTQEKQVGQLSEENTKLKQDTSELNHQYRRLNTVYTDLNNSYDRLLKNNQIDQDRLQGSLKTLEAQLNQRETELRVKEASLAEKTRVSDSLGKSLSEATVALEAREKRVVELETLLKSKEDAATNLKNSLAKSLLGYQDKGLTVTMKDGKVYVSLEEQLLFASGKTEVDPKGKEALLALAKVLNEQKDITIMVEGHTDNVPIKGGPIKDNWDLSVMRATAIIRILTVEGKVDPKRVIASGRGEFFPVDAKNNSDARKKNRRTEIIIAPQLDELYNIINSGQGK